MTRQRILPILFVSLMITALVWVKVASAHQPWFEDFDFSAEKPYFVRDSTVSTAIYSTLWPGDRDYFVFSASANQTVLLDMTIPQIEGFATFAPTMHVYGPGLPSAGYEIPPVPATEFYEPFSGTSYWDRQEERITMTEGGNFTVVVSHPQNDYGRYVFVIGTRETGGGDPAFSNKMRAYWTPPQLPAPEPTPTTPPPTATLLPTATPLPPTPAPTTTPQPPTPAPTQPPTAVPTDAPATPKPSRPIQIGPYNY